MAFSRKVILITGANSGIGKAISIHFARQGASLVLTGRNEANLKKVGAECSKLVSVQPLLVVGDLKNEDDVRNVFSSTIKRFGKLDVLVNNAGVSAKDTICEPSLEIFDTIIGTNLRSIYLLTSLAVPYLEKSKGNIVNVSSLAAVRAQPDILSYSAAKSALDQFTQCIALELAPKQIRVNSVNPAVIATPIYARQGMSDEKINAFYEFSRTTHPLGRVGTPDEVAESVVFLASDKASFTTGALLPVDGGRALAVDHISK